MPASFSDSDSDHSTLSDTHPGSRHLLSYKKSRDLLSVRHRVRPSLDGLNGELCPDRTRNFDHYEKAPTQGTSDFSAATAPRPPSRTKHIATTKEATKERAKGHVLTVTTKRRVKDKEELRMERDEAVARWFRNTR